MGRNRSVHHGLPPGIAKKGNRYYFVSNAPRRWIPLGTNLEAATTAQRILLGASRGRAADLLPDGFSIATLMAAIRRGARQREIPISITHDQVQLIVVRAGGKCELTRLPFSAERQPGQRIRLFAPSVDRIDSAAGYTAANCRLVCAGVNIALNRFGDGFLATLRLKSELL